MAVPGKVRAEPTDGAGLAAPRVETVRPLARGLALLRVLGGPDGPRMSPGELVRATGLARATVDRLVGTLAHLGYLRWDEGEVVLAPPLAALGGAYLTSAQLPRLLSPHLTALADALDEPVCLTVPDGDGIRIVTQANRDRHLSPTFLVGDLLPPGRSAAAPLFAPPSRATGTRPVPPGVDAVTAGRPGVDWAVDDQTLEPGLIAVAAPVRAPDGQVCAAMTVTSQTSRHSLASLCRLALPRLRETAAVGERRYAARLAELRSQSRTVAPATAPDTGVPAAVAGADGTAAASTRAAKRERGADFLQSLARGLAVITAFDAEHDRLTLSEAAQRTGLPRATVRRALLTLHQLGYLASRGRHFWLLPRVMELGYARLRRLSLAELAMPHLRRLAARAGAAATVAVLDGVDVRCLAHASADSVGGLRATARPTAPACVTATGRVLLAELDAPAVARALCRATALARDAGHRPASPAELRAVLREVRRRGYALVDEDGAGDGAGVLAVPVRDGAGRVVAAVGLRVPGGEAGPPPVSSAPPVPLPLVLRTAAGIEADLGALGDAAPAPTAG